MIVVHQLGNLTPTRVTLVWGTRSREWGVQINCFKNTVKRVQYVQEIIKNNFKHTFFTFIW